MAPPVTRAGGSNDREENNENHNEIPADRFVNMRVPEFSPTSTASWFLILESQFSLRNVDSSEARFAHTFPYLPVDVIDRVPPEIVESKNYAALKKSVVEFYESTKPELFAQLVQKQNNQGKRPSILLQDFVRIASKIGVPEDLVRVQFLRTLDPQISTVLHAQKDLPVSQLGKLADEISQLVYGNRYQNINSVNNNNLRDPPIQTPRSSSPISMSVSHLNQDRSRARSPANSNFDISMPLPAGFQPFSAGQRPRICRFHIYFANTARRCTEWCAWPDKRSAQFVYPSRSRSRSRSRNRLEQPNANFSGSRNFHSNTPMRPSSPHPKVNSVQHATASNINQNSYASYNENPIPNFDSLALQSSLSSQENFH